MDNTSQTLGVVLGGIAVWSGLAIWGIAKIIQKGYLSGIGCGVWTVAILLGWWSIPIILGLGPIWLVIAENVEAKRPCPLCKVGIPISATVCPNCHRDLPQNWNGIQELVALSSQRSTVMSSSASRVRRMKESGQSVIQTEIEQQLDKLQSQEAKSRWSAVQTLGEMEVNDERVAIALETLSRTDPVRYVREEALIALRKPPYQALLERCKRETPDVEQIPAAITNVADKKCTHCGLSNPADFKYCRECGTPLFTPPERVTR